MTKEIANPHDAFFKSVFGNLVISRQFFHAYLPQPLAKELDLDHLQVEKGSFVDERLHERHSDLLFRTVLKSGKRAWLYLLFEHQSTPEPDMPFRLLRYLVRIWEQHREQHPGEHPLPFIAPVVLYHGQIPWTTPRRFSEALDIGDDLGIRPTEMEYILVDLSAIPDQLLRERLELEIALSLFRHIRDENLLESFTRILPLLAELRHRKTGLEYIETILQYVYYVRSSDEWDELTGLVHQIDPVIEEMVMKTAAEQHFQQGETAGLQKGIRQGLEEGLKQGLEEGKLSEAHDVLLELLEEQFGVLPLSLTEKLRQIQSHGVLRMLRRQRKTCQTLDEFDRLLQKALQ